MQPWAHKFLVSLPHEFRDDDHKAGDTVVTARFRQQKIAKVFFQLSKLFPLSAKQNREGIIPAVWVGFWWGGPFPGDYDDIIGPF